MRHILKFSWSVFVWFSYQSSDGLVRSDSSSSRFWKRVDLGYFSLEYLVEFTREAIEAWTLISALFLSMNFISLIDMGLSSLFSPWMSLGGLYLSRNGVFSVTEFMRTELCSYPLRSLGAVAMSLFSSVISATDYYFSSSSSSFGWRFVNFIDLFKEPGLGFIDFSLLVFAFHFHSVWLFFFF